MGDSEEIKLYFDYKSPFAYLAMQPALDLARRYRAAVRWIPFQLRIKGAGERSLYSEWKVRYSYMDARRWANRRGGFPIRGPRKVYDSTAALVGALFAQDRGFFEHYTPLVYSRFFQHELEIDRPDEVAAVVLELGDSADDYRAFLAGPGPQRFEAGMEEAHADHIFGVPIFVFRDELFWGHDRIPLLEERLRAAGLGL
ncbi:MAG: DsbA family protein [Proteobacteria bacterium]|nr:DsbA family protein [Pseudomonadota bacterium]